MASVVLTGISETTRAVRRIDKGLNEAARRITAKSAAVLEAQIKRNFVGSHRRGERHVGGSFPNVVTGFARRSVLTDPVRQSAPGTYSTRVGPTAVYGRRLELGYPGGSGRGRQKTRPFPYVAPALDQTRMQLRAIAFQEWARILG